MFAVQPHDAEIWTQLIKDVYRFGRLDELRFDRPQVDVRNSRRLAVKDLGVRRSYEIRLRPRRWLFGKRFLQSPRLIRNIFFLPSFSASDVGEAKALAEATAIRVRRPIAGQVGRV